MPVAMICRLDPPPPPPPGPPRCNPPSGETMARTEVIELSSRFRTAANSGPFILVLSESMLLPPPELYEPPPPPPNRGMEKT